MKRAAFILPVFLFSLRAAAASSPAEDALYSRGLEDFRRERYVESLASFTDLLYLNPATPLGETARRRIWEIMDRIKEQESRARLTDAERRDLVKLALQSRKAQEDRRRQILTELEKVQKKADADPAGLVRALGQSRLLSDASEVSAVLDLEALQARQYLDGLRASLKEQVQKGRLSDPAALHEARGLLWLYEGDLQNTVDEWTQALAAAPGNEALKARLEGAKAGLEEQRKKQEIADALARGRSLYEMGDDQKAAQAFDRVLALAPKNVDALRFRRLIDQRAADRKRQESVGRVIDRARDALGQGRLLDAVSLLAQALEQDPSNEDARKALAEAKRKLSLKTEISGAPVRPAGEKPASAAPNRAEAEEAYALGMARYVQNDLDQAVALFQKAVALDPTFEEASGALQAALKEKSAR
jgi:tetratricopeptide (TPR) repeat protein